MSEKKDGELNPGGDGKPAGGDPANPGPGAQDDKSLEKADNATLLKVIADLRTENGTARTKNIEMKTALDDLTKKVNEMTESQKTAEQKEADKRAALEADAAKVPGLTKYADFVQAELGDEMKRIEKLKAEQKKPYTELLSNFANDDYLARLRAVRALKAAEGARVPAGNEGNPGEPGGGTSKATLADTLRIFPAGLAEARLAGLVAKE